MVNHARSTPTQARLNLLNRGVTMCAWGVIIPLPMGVEDLMQSTQDAQVLGFDLTSQRIADRVEPLFGPVLAVTTEGLEGLWLDFLRARERAKP